MAHNAKRNRRDTTAQDGDDYVYPTAKVRETKTRNRRSDKNLIKRGLVDFENTDLDDFEEKELSEWYDDTPMASDEDIAKEFGENSDPKDLFDFHIDCGYDWEDY